MRWTQDGKISQVRWIQDIKGFQKCDGPKIWKDFRSEMNTRFRRISKVRWTQGMKGFHKLDGPKIYSNISKGR